MTRKGIAVALAALISTLVVSLAFTGRLRAGAFTFAFSEDNPFLVMVPRGYTGSTQTPIADRRDAFRTRLAPDS